MKKITFLHCKSALLVSSALLCISIPLSDSNASNTSSSSETINISRNSNALMQSDTPMAKLDKQTVSMLKGKTEDELKFIYSTRNRHDRIRATKYTHDMVSGAVQACSSEQEDMKNQLQERYKEWWATLKPLLVKAENFVQESIKSASPTITKEVSENLALVEQAQNFANPNFNKEFATDREACDFLLDNMDKTEQHLGEMLQSIDEDVKLPMP